MITINRQNKCDFVIWLPQAKQDEVRAELEALDIPAECITDGMESRVCDLTETINIHFI